MDPESERRVPVPNRANEREPESVEPEDEGFVGVTVFDYLETSQGHEVAKRLLDILERLANAKTERDAVALRFDKYIQIAIVIGVLVASTTLAIADKFNTAMGLLLGSLVGYVFSRRGK